MTAPVPAPQSAPVAPQVMAAVAADENGSPITPVHVPRTGAPANPTAAVLAARFGADVLRAEVIWGETTVFVTRERVHDIVRFLHDEPSERYDYLVDVTAVEYRDGGRPLEVVWHLRALGHRRFLRLKVELPRRGPLWVPSVIDIYSGADWLERECFDMFGIRFEGHPDLRRLLMWEQYREGHPLRKDFPLRGRFSRAEQLKQALAADPEARYSMEELSIADAFDSLPADMKQRLAERAALGDPEEPA
ncbi:NADH-quinone oxidoreductase subunit C [Gemmatimonas sp.]|jgi:NADH-quinone oxidoreductase subunit C|uniref:NADH-quinone oxidoreductase subunit C n=1 Tax=Gemmatimonas sp. TaxID=1962908 RepID=UPI0022C92483|nr:NADH-quinone oxidoreductase subunit C [Gemmatimonas sp.]MCE2952409.1 NADH-quinone oxidoreductase subunit C [Gemmatimonas sp.]MCZ8013041.1 NADH-quinone oxidoreductase subunit C [Gemmatimonas sp.]MCZ8265315.1 NADH-quinone oxidoreductase subunit C [Gemmatimonas sp.]